MSPASVQPRPEFLTSTTPRWAPLQPIPAPSWQQHCATMLEARPDFVEVGLREGGISYGTPSHLRAVSDVGEVRCFDPQHVWQRSRDVEPAFRPGRDAIIHGLSADVQTRPAEEIR